METERLKWKSEKQILNELQESNSELLKQNKELLECLKDAFQLTDKLQMPTEFEIAQLRNKLFAIIKKHEHKK